jgi:Orange carotenoid protein, N-terminal
LQVKSFCQTNSGSEISKFSDSCTQTNKDSIKLLEIVMSTTDVNHLEAAISKFQALDANDKLDVLAQLYGEIAAEVAPTIAQNNVVDDNATNLVKEIQQLSSEQQVEALRSLVSGKQTSGYQSLGADSKLFFWFQLAQNLGKSVVGIPADHMPSEEAAGVLDLVGTPQVEDLVSFLKKAL